MFRVATPEHIYSTELLPNMGKLADYAIFEVHYDVDGSRIVSVRRCAILATGYGEPETKTRADIVDSIQSGKSHITIIEVNGVWKKGGDVGIVRGTNFIRTDNNETKADNLGNIRRF